MRLIWKRAERRWRLQRRTDGLHVRWELLHIGFAGVCYDTRVLQYGKANDRLTDPDESRSLWNC